MNVVMFLIISAFFFHCQGDKQDLMQKLAGHKNKKKIGYGSK